jgi:hypothetical protein
LLKALSEKKIANCGPKWPKNIWTKRQEITGVLRKLHEDHHNLYSSPNIRMMKWVGHAECIREKRYAYKVLVGKPEGETS